MEIRIAVKGDNLQLLELERLTAQGEKTRISYEKEDFFYHDNFFPSVVYVAEDGGRIIGSVGVGTKKYLMNGEKINGAYVHGLRISPEFRKKPVREFVQVYRRVLMRMKEEKSVFGYGYIKKDNTEANIFAKRRKYSVYSSFPINVIPCFFKNPGQIEINPEKVSAPKRYSVIPEAAEIMKWKGVTYTEMDLSPYYRVKVEHVSPFTVGLMRFVIGNKPVNMWEEKGRRMNYRIIQVLDTESEKSLKEFIKDQKLYSFNNGINLLAVLNRTQTKLKSILKYESNMYLHFYDESRRFTFDDFIIDLHDM